MFGNMALYRPPLQNALQYTLDSATGASDTTFTLNSTITSTLQSPGVGWIDRVDSSGNKTPTKREYFSFTGVSGVTLTGITRGLAGSTGQAHSVGAIVEFGPDIVQEQAVYDAITLEHTTTGQHASLPSINNLKVYTYVNVSGASLIGFTNLAELGIASLASIRQAYIGMGIASTVSLANLTASNSINASSASLIGFPIRPVWVLTGTLSGATTGAGRPIDMPESGTIDWVSVSLAPISPASNVSLVIDVLKNYTSIFGGSKVLSIPVNGSFVSTASIATKTFSRGDFFTVDVTTPALSMGGNATVKFSAR